MTSIGEASGKISTARVIVIAATVTAVLVLLFLLSKGETRGTDPEMSSQRTDMNQTAGSTTGTISQFPPGEWLQSSGSSSGNAAWPPAVIAPFDTLWVLSSGREIFSPLAVLGDDIYMAGNDMVLRCLNRHSGRQLWSRTVTCGLSGGVAADSQNVYFCGQDGYLYALNRANGSEEWKTGLGYHIFTDACVFLDSLVLAGNSQGSIAALDRETGDLIWSAVMDGLLIGPAFAESTVVFCSESGQTAALDINGTTVWSRGFASQPSAPSISGGRVFIGFSSGKVLALSLSTGETLWETGLNGISGRTVVSRPAVFLDSLVVAGTCDGRVFCLNAAQGELLWESRMENWVSLTPAVCDTIVYASCDDGRIHLLSLNTGIPFDTIETGSYSGTPLLLLDGTIYAGNSAGDLVAVQGTVPTDNSED